MVLSNSGNESGKKMIDASIKASLKKQGYRVSGSHSAVKICGWTKKFLRGEGGCYKFKFYGIQSHRCLQMTTSMSCANRCIFCWRDYKSPVSKEWVWDVDEPLDIIDESLFNQERLLIGFKGNSDVDKVLYDESNNVRHVALSLTGEPIIYPRFNELIKHFDSRNISTFVVTNGQYPLAIRDLVSVTQLYLSVDGPNSEILKNSGLPLFSDYWERLLESLNFLAEKKYRTCIRITLIKGINDSSPEGYADLINKGNPDFVEVKAFMLVGASKTRLHKDNMPWHSEVREFSEKIVGFLDDYVLVDEHLPSRVVLLAKKSYLQNNKLKTWLDFSAYNKLVLSGKDFSSNDYSVFVPEDKPWEPTKHFEEKSDVSEIPEEDEF